MAARVGGGAAGAEDEDGVTGSGGGELFESRAGPTSELDRETALSEFAGEGIGECSVVGVEGHARGGREGG